MLKAKLENWAKHNHSSNTLVAPSYSSLEEEGVIGKDKKADEETEEEESQISDLNRRNNENSKIEDKKVILTQDLDTEVKFIQIHYWCTSFVEFQKGKISLKLVKILHRKE